MLLNCTLQAVAFWDEESNFWRQDQLLPTFREYEIEEKFITTELVYIYI